MTVLIRVDMLDALQFPSGQTHPSPGGPLVIFVRAPEAWMENGAMSEQGKAAVLAALYGPTWLQGNSDGSRYVVLSFTSKEGSIDDPGLNDTKNTWVYEVTPAGTLEKRGAGPT